MNSRVREKLIDVAHKRGIIRYQELCDACGLGFDMYNNPHERILVGDVLDEITTHEFKNGRPLISSVVLTTTNEEGDGYFKLCERLGFGEWRRLKKNEGFSIEHIKKCHDFWSVDSNYKKYR